MLNGFNIVFSELTNSTSKYKVVFGNIFPAGLSPNPKLEGIINVAFSPTCIVAIPSSTPANILPDPN